MLHFLGQALSPASKNGQEARDMTKGNVARIVAILAAMAASAVFITIYVANGIVYGSLLGLKNREHDLQVASSRGKGALVLALCLQIVAIVTTAFSLPRQNVRNRSVTVGRLVIGALVSVVGTALIFALVLQVVKIFKL
jgi:hypothetical protein